MWFVRQNAVTLVLKNLNMTLHDAYLWLANGKHISPWLTIDNHMFSRVRYACTVPLNLTLLCTGPAFEKMHACFFVAFLLEVHAVLMMKTNNREAARSNGQRNVPYGLGSAPSASLTRWPAALHYLHCKSSREFCIGALLWYKQEKKKKKRKKTQARPS